jgi:hypothetical protein
LFFVVNIDGLLNYLRSMLMVNVVSGGSATSPSELSAEQPMTAPPSPLDSPGSLTTDDTVA